MLCGPLAATAVAAAAGNAPLPASSYSVRHACGQPAPGQAGCLALQLVPVTAAARARTHPLGVSAAAPIRPASAAQGAYGLRPQDLHSAYGLPVEAPSAQTLAIVDAYDDPSIEADLALYDREFSLPACTAANGCLTKINASGQASPLPQANGEWALEIALDVEVAHATCQSCRILLVEAASNSDRALEAAEDRAVLAGAREISNSWGGPEPATDSEAFNHPGVAITAAAGDNGYLSWDGWEPSERGFPDYPATSPHVVAVGGTRLSLSEGGTWAGESAWNNGDGATGGGCSARFPAPEWQRALSDWAAVGCGATRASADVAAVADPYTGVAVYDSQPWNGYTLGWVTVGGTSLSAPLVASAFALAGGLPSGASAPQTLYENALSDPSALHDVTTGSNGRCAGPAGAEGALPCTASEEAESCQGQRVCQAGPGYDGPTGVGTPDGLGAFLPVTSTPRFAGAGTGGTSQQSGASARGGNGAGTASEAPASPPPAAEPPRATPQAASGPAPHAAAVLSRLALARRDRTAARARRTRAARVDLSFTLSARSPVRVILTPLRNRPRASTARRRGARTRAAAATRRVRVFSIVARAGRNSWPLPGARRLAPGRYRLTLTPAGGHARSLVLAIA